MSDVTLPVWSKGPPGAGFRARSVRDDGVVWESTTRTVYEFPSSALSVHNWVDQAEQGAYYQDATQTIPVSPALRKLPWWRRISYGAVMAGGIAGLVTSELSRWWK